MQEHSKIKARINWRHQGNGREGKGPILEYNSFQHVQSICEEINKFSDGSYIHFVEYIRN